jgi:hypothetical protein
MNKRQVIILWIIAIALSSAVVAVKLTQKDTTKSVTKRGAGETLLESFPANEVASVELQGSAGTVTLNKKNDGWIVAQRDDYPANNSSVNEFLRTLGELKVTRGLEAGPSLAPRFGMDEASSKAEDRGITATFKDVSGKEITKVTLGKSISSAANNSPMGEGMSVGRYIRNHADESGVYAISEMFPSVSSEVNRWLDDDFLNVEKIKSITVSQKGKDDPAWKITRDTEEAEFKLEGASGSEVLDSAATSPLKSLFSYARFEDVVPKDKLAERTGDVAEKRTVALETFEGFKYTITITPAKAKPAPPASIAASPDTPPPASDNQLMTVAVTAELPKERKKEDGEKPEDAKAKDEAFQTRLKTLTEKLEASKKLNGRTYEVGKSTVESLLKDRSQIITKATPPAADPNKPNVQTLPGGAVVTPPAGTGGKQTATTPPIEAVTPPIAVPPVDGDDDEEESE